MTQRYETQVDTASAWKQFQGQTVAEIFPLQEYLGGSDHSAVFLTNCNSPEPAKAAIKLVLDIPEKTKQRLSRWELAAHLSHPNLLRLFHSGRCRLGDTNLLYAVMEYADEDLSQIIPQRALTAEEAEQMLPSVVDALAYIHSKGLVHGHIKPANILACGEDVKLSTDTICETGEPVGAPDAHDAPESTTSVAGDIWSLGTTTVEVLTQRLPQFVGGNQMRIQIPQSVPERFSDIAYGCLQIEPRRRWKLAEIRSRLQPDTAAPRPQLETIAKQDIVKQEIVKQEARKQEIPSVKRENRPSPQYQAASAAKQSPKKSNVGRTIGIGLLLVALIGGPLMLRHHIEAQHLAIPQSPEKSPETTAPEPPPVQSAAQSREVDPEETASKSAGSTIASASGATPLTHASTPASSATPREAASTPASAIPIESGVLHQAVPVVLDKARDTIRGTVRVDVKVAVDASGSVQHAELAAAGPSKYFANLALGSAQKFTFEPATNDGSAPREWILRFEFTSTGTKIFSARANP